MTNQILTTILKFISKHAKDLFGFFKSSSFSKALLIGIAITIPVVFGIVSDNFEIGLAICFGAFWCSPSDVNGSLKHKQIGILFSSILVVLISFIGGYLQFLNNFLFPILGLLTFCIAFISVYGFRASLISFSGLLALVLSFAHTSEELEVYQYALLIGVGGLWYLLLSTIWYHLNPKAQTEETLSLTFLLTADFIDTRRQLIGEQPNRSELQTQLMDLQSELIENHETLREIFISSRISSGRSNYQNKRLLVFIQLIEMLETAVANPVNYDKMDALFSTHPELKSDFQQLLSEFSFQLRSIARNINKPNRFPSHRKISDVLEKLKKDILEFKIDTQTEDYEDYLMLQNLLDYQKKQSEKIKKIKWVLDNPELSTDDLTRKHNLSRFIVSQDYDPKLLFRNLSFKSTIFKHSLRLAVTVTLGHAIGLYFDFQNPYWIILTIIVIMRPSYGLTKTRSKDRIIGTLIGAVLASGIVFLIHSPYVYGVLGVLSLVIAFSMVQKNYRASATFITLSVIFIYAILQPDVLKVIQFRVIDTLIGAGLSYVAMRFLWPAWSFMEIGDNIKDSLKANTDFFKSIRNYYQTKGDVPTSLKVNRKEAFVQMSNLSSAFQRMAQEPESKQNNIEDIYELVVINHTFLSSLASLNTYIQNHKTTAASEDFKLISDKITANLDRVCRELNAVNFENSKTKITMLEVEKRTFTFPADRITKNAISSTDNERSHKEAHLVWEQLYWLYSLSEKMLELTSKLKTGN
ncbi:putative membrane protein YccC [Winogradskyella epiphytica]|uniref:Putative membrane protein YccC n=1 Tax=Winogradskyella epiphytica TaxID=262005 RepID=A0A2V4XL06_9FLAO|nr:FUSC family membrane protein [Winogradskyella epiphytica]PYE82749.1 putative membrane protein YccC [Winogradskyella epiphytica]GGW53336.1 TIGR01666 family membrane protein [Winogradskyella epiphytica]